MNKDDARKTYSQVFTYYIIFMVIIGLVISIYIPEILRFMVSSEFYGAAKYIPLVVFSMIIFGSHYHLDFGILYSKKTKYLAYINVASASLNLITNYVLIKNFGLWGAIWSAVFILSLQGFLLFFISNKLYEIEYEFGKIFKFATVSVILYLISINIDFDFFLYNLGTKTALLFILPFTMKWFKILSPQEIAQFKAVFKNKLRAFFPNRTKYDTTQV
jgi:O-antigen/teichoic acid export membrane protein